MRKAIDLFVNPNFATENLENQLTQDVNEFYFKRGDDFFQDCTIDGLLAEMDDIGVEHCVLTIDPEKPPSRILEFSRQHPNRFSLCPLVDVNRLLESEEMLFDVFAKVQKERLWPARRLRPAIARSRRAGKGRGRRRHQRLVAGRASRLG